MPRVAQETVSTERHIAGLKPRPTARDVPVSGVRGLVVRVHPCGRRSFEVRYAGVGGVRRRLNVGDFTGCGGGELEAAKRRAAVAGGAAADGGDPAAERAAKRAAVSLGDAVDDLWPRFTEAAVRGHHGGRGSPMSATTLAAMESRYVNHIAPALGKRPVVGVLRPDVRSFLRDVVESGLAPSTVNTVGRNLRSLFAYAVHLDMIAANPVTGLAEPLKGEARDRMWSPAMLGDVLSTLERGSTDGVGPDVARALRFAVLTLARRASAAGLRWEELNWNEACWVCPAQRHKARRDFLTPLTPAITRVLRDAGDAQFGPGSDLSGRMGPVFRSDKLDGASVHPHSLTTAVTRVRAAMKITENLSLHDTRRTAGTHLRGKPWDVLPWEISLILSHPLGEQARVTSHYDKYEGRENKFDALNKWASLLKRE